MVGVGSASSHKFMHLSCWQEHHSDPDGAWPENHECLGDHVRSIQERASQANLIGDMRRSGMRVVADHCPGCGRWAHVEAGNDAHADHYWMVTNCKKCGRYETRGAPLWRRRHEPDRVTVEKLGER